MIRKILVPLDGSATAEAVLPLVTHLAQSARAEVELITVLTPVAIWDAAASIIKWDAEEAAAREYIEEKARELQLRGVKAYSTVEFGQAAYAVFDAAKKGNADFIAMTTHGRSGVTRFVLGSVADKLLHTAAPLLVVRPGDDDTVHPLVPAGIRKILVPLDGSELSLAAIPLAEEMARLLSASLVFCHVVTTEWIAYSGMETPTLYPDVLNDMKAAAKADIEKAAGESKGRGFDVDYFVGIGGPTDEIQRIAREQGADMIVMSTHGRSGPTRWIMGSVADALVRRTHLPCLLVRPKHVQHELESAAAEAADAAHAAYAPTERPVV
jgi:nucleotide-binding universal stress UspA family protein